MRFGRYITPTNALLGPPYYLAYVRPMPVSGYHGLVTHVISLLALSAREEAWEYGGAGHLSVTYCADWMKQTVQLASQFWQVDYDEATW